MRWFHSDSIRSSVWYEISFESSQRGSRTWWNNRQSKINEQNNELISLYMTGPNILIWLNEPLIVSKRNPRFQVKKTFFIYMDFHYDIKPIMGRSYIYNGNQYTGKISFVYCDRTLFSTRGILFGKQLNELPLGHQQSIMTSSERRRSEWDTRTMCKDRRFYRHLWIRCVV